MMRLHKFLAHAGVGGRLKCEELIAGGLVTVDGEVVTEMGARIDPEAQEVRFEGRRVRIEPRVHFLFHKPKGVVSTTSGEEKRPRVIDYFGDLPYRLYTAGRLDEDSEGLVIVTNDGDFAERVTHPRHGVPKTYQVRVRGRIEPDKVESIRKGLWLAEGKTSPARVRVVKIGREVSRLEVTLFEGRNREIRSFFARYGLPVLDLVRVRIGTLSLRGLPRGRYRRLSREELEELLHPPVPGEGAEPGRKRRKRRR